MSRYNVTAVADIGFVLVLNPVMGKLEDKARFGPYATLEDAVAFYNGEKCDPYEEEGHNPHGPDPKMYKKHFKRNSPLEWMNPLTQGDWSEPNAQGHGLHKVVIELTDMVLGDPVP